MFVLPVRLLMLRSLSAFCLSTCRAAFCLGRALCVLRRLKCANCGDGYRAAVRPSLCGAYHVRNDRQSTPAPLDPPRRLVIRSLPFRAESDVHGCRTRARERCAVLRIVAALAMLALLSRNSRLLLGYEEPTLRRTFGQEYETYCGQVRRWCRGYEPHRILMLANTGMERNRA